MEEMKLLSAEKARKFEMAEQDEKQHAEAYARGMEDARKRRADEAERRKRGEEDRRKLEDERAKNRERKLKAMNIKDGSWDEGKEAVAEEEARRGFRGANGGIRGTKSRGLGGSRFARGEDVRGEGAWGEEAPDVDRFLDDRYRGRGRGGRGRGGNGRGRGRGRGGYDGSVNDGRSEAPAVDNFKKAAPVADDFPALPVGKNSNNSDNTKADTEQSSNAEPKPTMAQAARLAMAPPPPPLPPIEPGGAWDDEMEALDAMKQSKT
jgi:hypothetical protein